MNPYVPPEDLLADRVILVTGAATGIGRAAASVFAQHGATLVLLDRQEKALEQTYDAIEQAGGAQPAIIALDLAKASLEHYQATTSSSGAKCSL
jgi:short-subunit dehydrogenase